MSFHSLTDSFKYFFRVLHVLDIPVGTMTSCYDEVLADYDPPTHEMSKMEERHLVGELLDGRCRPSNDPTVKLLRFGGA
jgi:hypothetical protein